MNDATDSIYRDPRMTRRTRRECLDWAMAFGCPLCGQNITTPPAPFLTWRMVRMNGGAGQYEPFDLQDGVKVVQLTNGMLQDRFAALCGMCYPRLATTDGIARLISVVNAGD